MSISPADIRALIRDKYDGDLLADISEDTKRLAAGEPLAYVIGWIPFLDLKILLDSRPLIPRPETEWWTEKLIAHLRYRFADEPFTLLDLCAGSGAIGLGILKAFPNAHITFGEIVPEHVAQVKKNLEANNLDASRATIQESNLFNSLIEHSAAGLPQYAHFNIIATNPPYIPDSRSLDASVTDYEPSEALFAGSDGMRIITKIISKAQEYLLPDGELWLECDISNAATSHDLAVQKGASEATIHVDQYGRPRLLVSHFE